MTLNNKNIYKIIRLWRLNPSRIKYKYGDISSWNVSKVTNMEKLFMGLTMFNENISKWDVSNVTNMSNMFNNTFSFNQNINNWNVSNVKNMSGMFKNAISFNQNINNWNVSNVTNMSYMFNNATSFNQNISNWNVSNVIDMDHMFNNATSFNQNISNWNVHRYTYNYNMFCLNTPIEFYKLKTTSFFDEPYKNMTISKRKKIFDLLFHWERKKNFILFLVNYNYILMNYKL